MIGTSDDTRKGLCYVVTLQSLAIFFLCLLLWSQCQPPIPKRGSNAAPTLEELLSPFCKQSIYEVNCSLENYTAVNTDELLRLTLDSPMDRMLANESERVYVSIKTASVLHAERLPPLLLTWLQTIDEQQIHIITDSLEDEYIQTAVKMGIQVVETKCPSGHDLEALCCKSGNEFEQYYAAVDRGMQYDWFCHFDDDAYVNMPNLVALLKTLPEYENVYLGHYRRNWGAKRVTKEFVRNFPLSARRHRRFYYALGPAYCISKELMSKLPPYFKGSLNFTATCIKTGFPDDAAVGVVIEVILKFPMFEVPQMLNHLDDQILLQSQYFNEVITMGYSEKHVLCIPNSTFPYCADPTRFLSYHCRTYPSVSWCPA